MGSPNDTRRPALFLIAISLATPVAMADEPPEVTDAKSMTWKAIDTGAFNDSIHHALLVYEQKKPPYEQYAPDQIVHIAENLLLAQNDDGGWPKNKDWLRVWRPDEARKLRGRSTFDNKNVWPQVDYLARVHRRTGLKRYADAANRGIGHILAEQRCSGGWRGCDVEAITFNDFVMSGIMKTLKLVLEDRDLYGFVGDERLSEVRKAYKRGLACILACQVEIDGRRTIWGQQHDHKTLAPVKARSFEPAALTTAESARVVRFLMSIDEPSPEVVEAVQAAVRWFDRHKISGIRIEEVKAEPVRFRWHWADFDRVEVKDPEAPPIWTRFYDLKEQKPLFSNRKGELLRSYGKVSRERRTGYAWYGYWPAEVLKDYPAWQKKRAPGRNVLASPEQ